MHDLTIFNDFYALCYSNENIFFIQTNGIGV